MVAKTNKIIPDKEQMTQGKISFKLHLIWISHDDVTMKRWNYELKLIKTFNSQSRGCLKSGERVTSFEE